MMKVTLMSDFGENVVMMSVMVIFWYSLPWRMILVKALSFVVIGVLTVIDHDW